jgi:hypothetical protein
MRPRSRADVPGQQMRRAARVGPARHHDKVRAMSPAFHPPPFPLSVDTTPPPHVVRSLQVCEYHQELEAGLGQSFLKREPRALRLEAQRPMV